MKRWFPRARGDRPRGCSAIHALPRISHPCLLLTPSGTWRRLHNTFGGSCCRCFPVSRGGAIPVGEGQLGRLRRGYSRSLRRAGCDYIPCHRRKSTSSSRCAAIFSKSPTVQCSTMVCHRWRALTPSFPEALSKDRGRNTSKSATSSPARPAWRPSRHPHLSTTFRSLIALCGLREINAHESLEQVLRLAPHWPVLRVLELSPKYWRATRDNLNLRWREVFSPLWLRRWPTNNATAAAQNQPDKISA